MASMVDGAKPII